jgi:hypothetical protein
MGLIFLFTYVMVFDSMSVSSWAFAYSFVDFAPWMVILSTRYGIPMSAMAFVPLVLSPIESAPTIR